VISYSTLIETMHLFVYRFRVITSYLSKVADLNLPRLAFGAPVVDEPVRISPRSLASEN